MFIFCRSYRNNTGAMPWVAWSTRPTRGSGTQSTAASLPFPLSSTKLKSSKHSSQSHRPKFFGSASGTKSSSPPREIPAAPPLCRRGNQSLPTFSWTSLLQWSSPCGRTNSDESVAVASLLFFYRETTGKMFSAHHFRWGVAAIIGLVKGPGSVSLISSLLKRLVSLMVNPGPNDHELTDLIWKMILMLLIE